MSRTIVFCDFDGTVTENDNIISIMKKFAPDEWIGLKDAVLAQEISIQEGVGKMFSLLPSHLKQDIISYLEQSVQIRTGFQEFLQFCSERDIPVYIVSGGMDFFVHPLLKEFDSISGIYCNQADFDRERIRIDWPHTCGDECSGECGCCKPTIINQLSTEEDFKIVIGDSITDLKAALAADFVIARDFLAEKCEEHAIPHETFDTFHDCASILSKLEGVGV
ncbi:2-hydroxy-3-keto-5-methylthiopentenyl-1-phosphate phosphatase [Falsibacillus pallidus]|uniref:2-hydroxy-3-keto-5-methylthiopentenyl-1- phosphate phosphatase n=1 Tax=Falsibacillus pallidus TaxID=493781 RepID=UPI003D98661B